MLTRCAILVCCVRNEQRMMNKQFDPYMFALLLVIGVITLPMVIGVFILIYAVFYVVSHLFLIKK